MNWIAPTTKVGAPNYEFISRDEAANEKSKIMAAEYGDNGGIMACTAVHMMEVQDKLIEEVNQIEVQTLICAGTDDRMCSTKGSRYNITALYHELFPKPISATEHAHSQMSKSTLKLYDGAYHNLCEELPETVEAHFDDVREFILELS